MSEKVSSQKPSLGRTVIVTTAKQIGGQTEHAAIITGVVSDAGAVHLMLMPAGVEPYPVSNVLHEKIAPKGAMCWRWPSKS